MNLRCPRCNSEQKFALQRIPINHSQEQLIYKCNICRWKKVVLVGSSDTIDVYTDVKRLKKKARRIPAFRPLLARKLKRLDELIRKDADS